VFENIGVSGFIMIILIALLLFGPSKLPELGRAAGATIREFKKAASGIMSDEEPEAKKEPAIQEKQDRSSRLPE
jgi:sec-independent protein translocase protein TatA